MRMSAEASHRFREAITRGDAGRASGDFRTAIQEYTNALVVRGDDLTTEQEADLRARIAECFLQLGDFDSAGTAITPAEKLEGLSAVTAGAVKIAQSRLAMVQGRTEEAAAAAGEAWEALRGTGENVLVARALTCRAHAARQLGSIGAARDDYADAMAAARRAADDHEIGLAAAHLGSLLWLSGGYVEARRWHRRAVERHEASGSEANLARNLFSLAIDETHAGDWKRAEALLVRAQERAEAVGDAWLSSAVAIARGDIAHRRGEDPRGELEEVRRAAEEAGFEHDLVVIAQVLGDAAIARGDWPEARRVLCGGLDRARNAAPESQAVADMLWRLGRAEEALGDPGGMSFGRFEDAVRIAAERGFRASEANARRTHGLALLGRGRVEAAREELAASHAIARELQLPWETGLSLLALGELQAETAEAITAAPRLRAAAQVFRSIGAGREAARAAEALAAATGETPGGEEDGDPFGAIITVSEPMREAIARARRIAPSNIPVLVTGETGTGKELFARAIHRASSRADHPFLAVNCAALSETLLESELFGHEKGAFTGADRRKLGIFEAAAGGTVFLDEVAKAPLSLQAKLLRVLDTGEVRRVGGIEAIHVDVRIVGATNRDLDELVDEGGFLPDLLYRLRGFEIRVAPLREREGDIALLFERFAGRRASDAALEVLESHGWPGNVREVRNLAESAAFLTYGRGPIPVDALPDRIRERRPAPVARLVDTEREAVLRALEEAEGNRSRAARFLGISRQTLYTKMSKFGISRANAA